jgi:hypothetical protein
VEEGLTAAHRATVYLHHRLMSPEILVRDGADEGSAQAAPEVPPHLIRRQIATVSARTPGATQCLVRA